MVVDPLDIINNQKDNLAANLGIIFSLHQQLDSIIENRFEEGANRLEGFIKTYGLPREFEQELVNVIKYYQQNVIQPEQHFEHATIAIQNISLLDDNTRDNFVFLYELMSVIAAGIPRWTDERENNGRKYYSAILTNAFNSDFVFNAAESNYPRDPDWVVTCDTIDLGANLLVAYQCLTVLLDDQGDAIEQTKAAMIEMFDTKKFWDIASRSYFNMSSMKRRDYYSAEELYTLGAKAIQRVARLIQHEETFNEMVYIFGKYTIDWTEEAGASPEKLQFRQAIEQAFGKDFVTAFVNAIWDNNSAA